MLIQNPIATKNAKRRKESHKTKSIILDRLSSPFLLQSVSSAFRLRPFSLIPSALRATLPALPSRSHQCESHRTRPSSHQRICSRQGVTSPVECGSSDRRGHCRLALVTRRSTWLYLPSWCKSRSRAGANRHRPAKFFGRVQMPPRLSSNLSSPSPSDLEQGS